MYQQYPCMACTKIEKKYNEILETKYKNRKARSVMTRALSICFENALCDCFAIDEKINRVL